MATKTAAQKVVFISKRRGQTLLRATQRPQVMPDGRWTDPPCIKYEFAPHGRIEVWPNEKRARTGPPDPTIDPDVPTEEDSLTWLRRHEKYNVEFWELGQQEQADDTAQVLGLIAEASAKWDVDALENVVTSEKDGANRPLVLQAAEQGLETVRATLKKANEVRDAG